MNTIDTHRFVKWAPVSPLPDLSGRFGLAAQYVSLAAMRRRGRCAFNMVMCSGELGADWQKFFGSFFQKRTRLLTLLASRSTAAAEAPPSRSKRTLDAASRLDSRLPCESVSSPWCA